MKGYLVVYERGPRGWGAYCPDLPGLGVAGKSRSEVKRLFREAIRFHLEGLKHQKMRAPRPAASAEVISVSA